MTELDGEPPTQEDFIEALAVGDATRAASILRHLNQLDGHALEALADMLDKEPTSPLFYPFRLKLVRWKVGNPPKSLGGKARSFTRGLAIAHAYKKFKKLEAALHAVQAKIGYSMSTLKSDWAAFKKKVKPKKSSE